MRVLSRVGWCLVAVDLIAAASLFFAQDIGDAATRGLGQGFGSALGHRLQEARDAPPAPPLPT